MKKENYNNLKVLSGRFSTIIRFVDEVEGINKLIDKMKKDEYLPQSKLHIEFDDGLNRADSHIKVDMTLLHPTNKGAERIGIKEVAESARQHCLKIIDDCIKDIKEETGYDVRELLEGDDVDATNL